MFFLIGPGRSPYWKRLVGALVLLAILAGLSSCGWRLRTRKLFGKTLDLEFTVAEKANQDHPVAVDFLLVYDKKLLDKLLEMKARDWFQGRTQIRRDYPSGKGFDSWSWEWVPGQAVPRIALPLRLKAKAGILFADYRTPGDHRVRVRSDRDLLIYLDENGFVVRTAGKSGRPTGGGSGE